MTSSATQRTGVIPFPQRLWTRRREPKTIIVTVSARSISEAQWRIVDALQDLPREAQELVIRQALETLDVVDVLMVEGER